MIEYDLELRDLNQNPDEETKLPQKFIIYTIDCGGGMRVATSWEDNRAGSVTGSSGYSFGLGKYGDDKNIGRYTIYSPATANSGAETLYVVIQDGGMDHANWEQVSNFPLLAPNKRSM